MAIAINDLKKSPALKNADLAEKKKLKPVVAIKENATVKENVDALTHLEPTTKQLIGNLVGLTALGGIGSYITISRKSLLGSLIATATTSMWITQCVNDLWQRKKQIESGEYKEKPLQLLPLKEIKTTNDVEKYLHGVQCKLARQFITQGALEAMTEYLAFDLIPDQLIYQKYQETHPPSAYQNVGDFLQKEKLHFMASFASGILAYPMLNLFDKAIPKTGRLISSLFLKSEKPEKSEKSEKPEKKEKKEKKEA